MTKNIHATAPKGTTISRPATVLLVLAAYFIVNIAIRLIVPHGLELDEAEQTYFSQWLLTGYSSQPPFYNWLEYAAIHLFGASLLTLTVLKNLMLFATYLFYWLAAREAVGDKRLATVAALSLLTIPQVAFEAQRDLSHTVAAMFGTAFFLFAFLRIVNRASFGTFLLLGIATGIGGLTKYNFALIPVASLIAVALDRDLRSRLLDWRIIVSAVVAVAILSPHLAWLVDNGQSAGNHTLRKMLGDDGNVFLGIIDGVGSLAGAVIAFLALTLVVLAAVFRESLGRIVKASSPKSRLIGRILLVCLVAILLMIVFGGVERVRDRWLTPILLIVPLYAALKVDAAAIDAGRHIRRLWGVAIVIMVIVPAALFGRALAGHYGGKYTYTNIPFPTVARTIAPMAMQPGTVIVAGDGHLAGNLRLNLSQVPVILQRPPTGMTPVSLSGFTRAVFVWRNADGSPPMTFEETFGDYLKANGLSAADASSAIVSFPYLWGAPGDQALFAYAVMDLPRK